jgi:hypothetical protein
MHNETTPPQEPKQVLIFPVGFGKYDVVWGRIVADNLAAFDCLLLDANRAGGRFEFSLAEYASELRWSREQLRKYLERQAGRLDGRCTIEMLPGGERAVITLPGYQEPAPAPLSAAVAPAPKASTSAQPEQTVAPNGAPEPEPEPPSPPEATFGPVKYYWTATEPCELSAALSAIRSALLPCHMSRHAGVEIDVQAFARDLCWHPKKLAAMVRYWAREGKFKIVFAEGDIIRLAKIGPPPPPRPKPKVEPPPAAPRLVEPPLAKARPAPPPKAAKRPSADDMDAELDAVFGKPKPPPKLSHAGRELSQPGQKLSPVRQPEPEPDPAELQRQYDAGLPDWQRWQRNAQIRELGDLLYVRRRNGVVPRDMEFPAWCASLGIDPQRWYSAPNLSEKVKLSRDEDEIFGTLTLGRWRQKQHIKNTAQVRELRAERFPTRFYPLNETLKERKNRRRRIYRAMDQRKHKKLERKKTMLQERTPIEVPKRPAVTMLQALFKVAPLAPERIKFLDAMTKLLRFQGWKTLTERAARNKAREWAHSNPDLGYEVVLENGKAVAYLWRRK